MTSQDVSPPRSPQTAREYPSLVVPRSRSPEKAAEKASRLVSEYTLPFRRSNSSLSSLFASTSRPTTPSRIEALPTTTPLITQIPQSVFSPGSHARSPDLLSIYRDLIIRSFAPHIAVLPSTDTEELLAQKGFTGGFLELVRPYGEKVQGKVTIRDSTGSGRSWEDYAVRFIKLRDGLEPPRIPDRRSTDHRQQNVNGVLDQYFPTSSARLRTGGDVPHIEEAVQKHLAYAESQAVPAEDDYFSHGQTDDEASPHDSPFHLLYLRRLLSGLPLSPHETFSHPVACVIAISSRHPDPIDGFRQLAAATATGDQRLPQWVNNDYLRYYVLVHDEHDNDQRSTMLFDQMKRHFGLHCHLLRLRSDLSVPTDDDCARLPVCEWMTAAEELVEIQKRETLDDDEAGPWLFESDAANVKSFVRELVTQSIIPSMERLCSTWNEQTASRRRGISARLFSLSKKWTPFGSSSRNSASPLAGNSMNSGSNYDSVQGFYRPDAPEAILRKLADYAFMLRDLKLAQSTYELLRTDYSNDKAWKYYAGANEMSAITTLLSPLPLSTKTRTDGIDQMLEAASYSFMTRCLAPYYALRTLAVGLELLVLREGSSADDAARWASRIIELELVGPVGHALFSERAAACYASRKGTGTQNWGSRRRKSALWSVFATEAWLGLRHPRQAALNLKEVIKLYRFKPGDSEGIAFEGMRTRLEDLQAALTSRRMSQGSMQSLQEVRETLTTLQPPEESVPEKLDVKKRRPSGLDTRPAASVMSHPLETEFAGLNETDENA